MTTLGIKIAVIASGVIVFAGLYYAWHSHVYSKGYAAAIAGVAADNREAVNAVNRKKVERRNCVSGGGAWDQSSGLCIAP